MTKIESFTLGQRQREKLKRLSVELGVNKSATVRMLIDQAEVGQPIRFPENKNSQCAVLADVGAMAVNV